MAKFELKQKYILYITNLVARIIANGLLPILPLYALKIGMSKSLSGVYMSASYMALFFGTIISGYIFDKFKIRKLVFSTAILSSIFLLFFHGFTDTPLKLFIATILLWFSCGIQFNSINAYTGMETESKNRGKSFGLLTFSTVLGTVLGGLIIGPLIDKYSFQLMFIVLSIISISSFVVSLFVKDKYLEKNKTIGFYRFNKKIIQNKQFILLLFSGVIISFVLFMGRFGVSINMKHQNFSYTDISFVAAIASIITLPIPYISGKISDKQGRLPLILTTYSFAFLFLIIMIFYNSFGAFLIATTAVSILSYNNISLGTATVTDISSKRNLGKSISFFSSTTWIGASISFFVTGQLFDSLGNTSTFLIGIGITLIAICLVIVSFMVEKRKL